ncbi:MAG: hypothetical protein KDA91_21710 [Planctomycetaceae bacterium]|nr:hypothetical protein [Planctomycetaceae bacterium]
MTGSVFGFSDIVPVKPKVVVGAICHTLSPADMKSLISELEAEYKTPLSNFGADLHRWLERRFDDRLRIPYPKGLAVVETGKGLDLWHCEQIFTVEAAAEVVDDFVSQWKTVEPIERPNFEVETANPSPNVWTVSLVNLTWIPKFIKTTDKEKAETRQHVKTEWTATRRVSQNYCFRFTNGWLWSSHSKQLLDADVKDLTPAPVKNTKEGERRLIAQLWFHPDSLSVQSRNRFLGVFKAFVSTNSQQRDSETSESAHSRQVLNTCRMAAVSALLNDVESIDIQVSRSTERIWLSGQIIAKKDSDLSLYLASMIPERRHSIPTFTNESVSEFRLCARIPGAMLALFKHEDHTSENAAVDVVATGSFKAESLESLAGHVTVQCADASGVLSALLDVFPSLRGAEPRHPLLRNVPVTVSTDLKSDDSSFRVCISGPKSTESAVTSLDVPSKSEPRVKSEAFVDFQIDDSLFDSIGEHVLVPSTGQKEPSTELESQSDIAGDCHVGRGGISLSIHCTKAVARRIVASVLVQAQ